MVSNREDFTTFFEELSQEKLSPINHKTVHVNTVKPNFLVFVVLEGAATLLTA